MKVTWRFTRYFSSEFGLAMVGVGTAPLWLKRALYAADAPRRAKKFWWRSSSAARPTG